MRNKHFKSIISLLLTVVMVLSAVFCVTAAESDVAQTGASGTVYFENTSNWSNLHCYMWNGNGETKNADWPGQPMTQVEGNVFKYTTSTSYDNVIFNNGGNGQQTGDLQFPGDGQIYNGSSWRAYEKHVTDPS
ncbi:MAG: starch-binding protein, partial [Eubacteriales bacterium]|nr:starch-binding protein [Eubacteriales bacterium]